MTIQQAFQIASKHHQAGRLSDAIAAYQRAIGLYPARAELHNNLGIAYHAVGQFTQAIIAYRQAIALQPDCGQAWNNLGNALKDSGDLDQAIAAYRRSLALRPDNASTYNNLATAQETVGQLDEAIASYQRAVRLDPHSAQLHSNLVYALHFHPGYDAQALFEAHLRWRQRHAQTPKPPVEPHTHNRSPDRRLKIGYVSPDFRDHVVGRFFLPLLAHHDHDRFEVFCYSNRHQPPDQLTHRLSAHADQWRQIASLSDERVAHLISQEQIDILVDLSMHMAGNRLPVFARKPAPLQVTYLAYCSTTGLDTMDYRLTDPYLDPPGQGDRYYSEQSLRLPQTYWCYQPPVEPMDVGPLPALSAGYITFGCLNNFRKVSAPALAAWCQLLRAVPQSRLLLHAQEGNHRQHVYDLVSREGIDPQRLSFVGFVPLWQYFELYRQIDIALDPFPYAGGTTSCDALWMGVPLVTLRGRTAVGRGGVSILSNLGLPELIGQDTGHYIALAGELANNLPRLAELRLGLRPRMLQSPLMNAPRFAWHVESAYRHMWTAWAQAGHGPTRSIEQYPIA